MFGILRLMFITLIFNTLVVMSEISNVENDTSKNNNQPLTTTTTTTTQPPLLKQANKNYRNGLKPIWDLDSLPPLLRHGILLNMKIAEERKSRGLDMPPRYYATQELRKQRRGRISKKRRQNIFKKSTEESID